MTNETGYSILFQYNHISQLWTKYAGIILYILCFVGTVMNVVTFAQRTGASRSCSLYLLFASICDVIHLHFGPLSNILQYGFHYNWTIRSIFYCKMQTYITYVFSIISATFTILASIDRYVLSSKKTTRWRFTTSAVAMRCVPIVLFFWSIVTIPLLFCYSRHNDLSHNEHIICSNSLHRTPCVLVQILYVCILNGFLPPLVLLYFGFLTCINTRHLRERSLMNSSRVERINCQMTRMLILQSIKSGLASLPYSIFTCYSLATLNARKSLLFQAKENLVNQIVYLLFWSNYTSFFVYISSSSIFRRRCIKTLKKFVCCFSNNTRDHQQHDIRHLTDAAIMYDEKDKTARLLSSFLHSNELHDRDC